MVNNVALIRDFSRVDDGWSGAGVGHFPQPRFGRAKGGEATLSTFSLDGVPAAGSQSAVAGSPIRHALAGDRIADQCHKGIELSSVTEDNPREQAF